MHLEEKETLKVDSYVKLTLSRKGGLGTHFFKVEGEPGEISLSKCRYSWPFAGAQGRSLEELSWPSGE